VLLPAELTDQETARGVAYCAQDGLPFGHLALRQVGASVVSNRSDIKLLAFWWTNSVHLRGFLQSLNLALEDGHADTPTSLHWASEVCAHLAWVRAHVRASKSITGSAVTLPGDQDALGAVVAVCLALYKHWLRVCSVLRAGICAASAAAGEVHF
jgi:hypothetical protein